MDGSVRIVVEGTDAGQIRTACEFTGSVQLLAATVEALVGIVDKLMDLQIGLLEAQTKNIAAKLKGADERIEQAKRNFGGGLNDRRN